MHPWVTFHSFATADDQKGERDLRRRLILWRWLIIDEVSMVSARLLAEIDMRLRDAARSIGSHKCRSNGDDRPFGGLNVLLVGDFWQLEPSEGGSLGAVPTEFIQGGRKAKPRPDIEHGQSLLWARTENSAHGVSEVHTNERNKDAWLQEVQDEIRHGRLSFNNWCFLHGKKTTVPGSWIAQRASCGRSECQELEMLKWLRETKRRSAAH